MTIQSNLEKRALAHTVNKILCKIFGHVWGLPEEVYDPFLQSYKLVCLRCDKNRKTK